MLAALNPYLPYLLPIILLGLNEIVMHNKNIISNSLVSMIWSSIVSGLKAMINAHPPEPLP